MTNNCWNSQALAEISYAVSGAFRAVPLLCDAKAGALSLLQCGGDGGVGPFFPTTACASQMSPLWKRTSGRK